MRKKGISGRTITVKIRYGDFTTLTRSNTLPTAISTSEDIYREALKLARPELEGSIRLLGIRISNLAEGEGEQLPLFGAEETTKVKKLESALDKIQDKFGKGSIKRGTSMEKGGKK